MLATLRRLSISWSQQKHPIQNHPIQNHNPTAWKNCDFTSDQCFVNPQCDPIDSDCIVYRSKARIAFITSYFRPDNLVRRSEIDICLASVVGNPVVDEVHVLLEAKDKPLPSFAEHSTKIHQTIIPKRPLMGDFIQYACDHLRGQRVIFANSDISYDATLEFFKMVSDARLNKSFYAISRWWLSSTGITPHPYPLYGSYDTFAFSADSICRDDNKIKTLVSNLNYPLGVLGAENRLLYEVSQQFPDLQFYNPAITVKTLHIHGTSSRSEGWGDRVNEDGKSKTIDSGFVF
ncbi:putative ATP-dependent RNA helicase ddx49 [Mortierella sp. GBA30]|nr:putative ATP-dependent RNA helicase ddx49 [Mortierella sp. GBA30]